MDSDKTAFDRYLAQLLVSSTFALGYARAGSEIALIDQAMRETMAYRSARQRVIEAIRLSAARDVTRLLWDLAKR